MYLQRSLATTLVRAASEFPVVVLTGPRQAGKTTLLRHELGKSHRYVSVDAPEVRAAAARDPRTFLAAYRPPVIIDEIQQAPTLLPYIRAAVDEDRDRAGQYVLSGSQNLLLMANVTETLAGRAAVLRLLPLSLREAMGVPDAPLPWRMDPSRAMDTGTPQIESDQRLWRRIVRGFYPEPTVHPDRNSELWHSSYLMTYLERDVRSIRQVSDLTLFQTFLSALAARTGQLLSLSEVSRDTGVPTATCRAWMSVLEATHQILILRPYHRNIGKRLVKAPKLYFVDTGTVCQLCGISTTDLAAKGPMAGALFETAVVTEACKSAWHRGKVPHLYYWKTSGGAEVDLIVDEGGVLTPVEAKTNATPRYAAASGIRRFRQDYPATTGEGWVIHPGDTWLPLSDGVMAAPFGAV